MRTISTPLILALLAPPATSAAQDTPARRHELAIEHLQRTAAEITANGLAGVRSFDDWKRIRPNLLRQVLYMLGLDPLPDRTPLEAKITGSLKRSRYRLEKLVFQSRPGLYVTGNLYLPREPAGPRPAILYVCGHSPHPLGAKWSYQDHAIWFVEHGFVCFVVDTLEFGEVAGIHHGTHDLNMWSWLSLGYTPAGVEVWNAIRAVDYLKERPEVDGDRIGITGRSGGGAVSWYAAAVDERIAAAVPVCGTFTFGSQAAHWIAGGQCDCIYFHNTYLLDLPAVGALIAPRPLLIVSGRKDSIFPPDGYHAVYQRVKRIFDLYPDPEHGVERVAELDEDVGHQSTPLMRKAAREWMRRWLTAEATALELEPIPKEKREGAEDLACLTGLPPDAINYRVHDSFVPPAKLEEPATLAGWNERRERLMRELREKTFRWFPRAQHPFKSKRSRSNGGWASRYADYEEAFIETEPGVPIRIQLLSARGRTREVPLVVYAKRRGESFYAFDIDELLPLLGRVDVAIVNPRLSEHPVTGREYADIERTAAWCGRTVASMQVWDVLRAIDWLAGKKGLSTASISLYGKGEMGIVALYAGLLDERIGQLILRDPPPSHWQGAALLNVLRITDIPEAAAAFAPREIVFLREVPPGFELTGAVYRLCGEPSGVRSAGSLPEALNVWQSGAGAAEVIFSDDFESWEGNGTRSPPGTWSVRRNAASRTRVVRSADEDASEHAGGGVLEIACWAEGGGSQVGGLSYTLGNYNHATEGLGDGYDEVFVRYAIKFDEDYRAVRNHGANLGGRDVTRNDSAWVGMAGIRDVSERGYFYSGVQPYGERGGDEVEMGFYSYHLDKKSPWGENYEPVKRIPIRVGEWHVVERHMKLNSVDPRRPDPAVADGIEELWIDGELAIRREGVRFRRTPHLKITFFSLETYYHGLPAEYNRARPIKVFFDNVTIARKRIGPAGEKKEI